ncbi:open rectifier potassium channel protein 1-like [Bacillus rossius redtenbacheri]|uniref:open rectifier potassium channel protein 1-like n=1 Tax=Bacillus rossius redtenbacheri TaxID=93214 RepID=UPI002FDD91E9
MKVRLLLPASCFLLPSCFFLLLASCPSCFFLSFLLLPAAFFLSFLVLPSCFFLPVLPVLPASCPSSFISFLFPGLPASSCILPASCFLLLPDLLPSCFLRHTHSRLWVGVTRDVAYVRCACCCLLPASCFLPASSCFLLPVLPASSCPSCFFLLPSSCPSWFFHPASSFLSFLSFLLPALHPSYPSCFLVFLLLPASFLLPASSCFLLLPSCFLRHTHSRLWVGVTRDVAYVRRVLNELYLLKMKPVYRDEDDCSFRPRSRSNSLPSLAAGEPSAGAWRRRAASESLSLGGRVLSESDLQRVDRQATFGAGAAALQPAELLARFVTALGGVEPRAGGEHGLSDRDILASEEAWGGSGWTLGGGVGGGGGAGAARPRARAASEVHIHVDGGEKPLPYNAEWTWSGVDASSEIHKMARARADSEAPGRRASLLNIGAWWKNPLTSRRTRSKARSIGSLLLQGRRRRRSLPERHSPPPPGPEARRYLAQTRAGRNTIAQPQRHSAASSQQDSGCFLEETTLGDLFRALSNIQAAPPPPPPLQELFTPPPGLGARRASLRPPASRRASLTPSAGAGARRASLRPPPAGGGRRFSVRPVAGGGLLPPQAPWMRLRAEGRSSDPELAASRALDPDRPRPYT